MNDNKQSKTSTSALGKAGEGVEDRAFLRLSALCAASEHCRHDVEEKMRRWQMTDDERQRVTERLVKEKFIDEERYCRAFVSDKMRYNKWGRRKIEQALMMKRIPQDVAQTALDEIDEEEYSDILRSLIAAKRRGTKAKSEYELDCKLIRFVMGRGFLLNEIKEVMEKE